MGEAVVKAESGVSWELLMLLVFGWGRGVPIVEWKD